MEIWQQVVSISFCFHFQTFFAFSSKYLGLKMKQYYANIFSSEKCSLEEKSESFTVFFIFPKLVSRA